MFWSKNKQHFNICTPYFTQKLKKNEQITSYHRYLMIVKSQTKRRKRRDDKHHTATHKDVGSPDSVKNI